MVMKVEPPGPANVGSIVDSANFPTEIKVDIHSFISWFEKNLLEANQLDIANLIEELCALKAGIAALTAQAQRCR